MTMQPTERPATTGSVPAQRRSRDIVDLLLGRWPMAELFWPFEHLTEPAVPTGLPIRVEEVVDNDQLVVRAELPGVDPEKDIEVTIDAGHLTITAERREKTEEKSERGYRSEFRYGTFSRRIPLPEGTSPEVVSASYRDGVLEVRMPAPMKAPGARRIPVDRG